MSDLFDKLVEGAGQVISEVDKGGQIQSAISGIRGRMADADRKRRINHVRQQLQELRSQEAQAINALSAQVLALHEAGSLTQPELLSLCKGVDEVRAQVKEKEVELEKLQPSQPQPVQSPPVQPKGAQVVQPQPDARAQCPSCGVTVVAGATFCQTCGTQLVEEEPPAPVFFCVHCGAQLREGARFCPKCGQSVPES
jgi:membrane protease subunit (stomatin/prohibitin family)